MTREIIFLALAFTLTPNMHFAKAVVPCCSCAAQLLERTPCYADASRRSASCEVNTQQISDLCRLTKNAPNHDPTLTG